MQAMEMELEGEMNLDEEFMNRLSELRASLLDQPEEAETDTQQYRIN